MIFEVKKEENTYIVDDLKLFNQQTKAFRETFSQTEKKYADGVTIAHFDNADAVLYTQSDRVLISLKEVENEDN